MRRWEEIVKRVPADRNIVGAELGIWRGKMSEQLFNCLPCLTLHMFDRWQAMPEGHIYLESGSQIATETQDNFDRAYEVALRLTKPFQSRRFIYRADIDDMVSRFDDNYFDFVFIDADHTYDAVKKDIANWESKVKPGGLLCGHDYAHEEGKGWGVKKAVDEFVQDKGLDLETGDDHTWFVWKR